MPRSFLIKKKKQAEFDRKLGVVQLERAFPTNPDVELETAEWLITSHPSNGSPLSSPVVTAVPSKPFSTQYPLTKQEEVADDRVDIRTFKIGIKEPRFDGGRIGTADSSGSSQEILQNTSHIFKKERTLTEQTSLQVCPLKGDDPADTLYGWCNDLKSNGDTFFADISHSGMLRFPTVESLITHEKAPKPTASDSEEFTDDLPMMDFTQSEENCDLGRASPNSPSPSMVSMTDSLNSETSAGYSVATTTNRGVSRETSSAGNSKKYRYACDVCGKTFSRSNTLTTHKRIHTGDKPFKCEQCGRAFRQPGNLTRHRLTHTTIKPYVCPQCKKAFNRASNLHTHMRTHTNYKPFVCDFCGKGFHQKIDMKIHRYTHTGEKPHKCQKCGRGFKQLTHLTYHMRTHSDVRMYQCEYCGKGFNQKGNLQAHIYGHTGQRPYKCDVCGKGFTLASTLNTHKRTHAPKKPFQCELCEKAFYQKNALKTHYIASHPFANGISLL